MTIELIVELLTGENYLGSVDYDYIISGIKERSVCGLVLTS